MGNGKKIQEVKKVKNINTIKNTKIQKWFYLLTYKTAKGIFALRYVSLISKHGQPNTKKYFVHDFSHSPMFYLTELQYLQMSEKYRRKEFISKRKMPCHCRFPHKLQMQMQKHGENVTRVTKTIMARMTKFHSCSLSKILQCL